MRRPILFAAALLASGCSGLPPAQMNLPPALAQQGAPLAIEGVGGGNTGRFYVGPWQGSFTRTQERLAFFDSVITNRGHTGFVIEGPGISWTLEAECRMHERVLEFGVVAFTPKPVSYACDFTAEGRGIPARFELQEVQEGLADALSRRQRRGEIALGGEVVQIASVHKLKGSPFELASPIGYVFEQGGKPVGAVEINGAPRLFIADPANRNLGRTLTVAAMALALFRDPANSPLSD